MVRLNIRKNKYVTPKIQKKVHLNTASDGHESIIQGTNRKSLLEPQDEAIH